MANNKKLKTYLVTHSAMVGRTKEEGAALDPLYLTYYTTVEATSSDDASTKVVQYRDPGFRSRVVNVEALDKAPSLSQLREMFEPAKVITDKPTDLT